MQASLATRVEKIRFTTHAKRGASATGVDGRGLRIVREKYLRTDVPCGSSACNTCNNSVLMVQGQPHVLAATASHYVLPDELALAAYLDVLDACPCASDVVLLQSVVEAATDDATQREMRKFRGYCSNSARRVTVFANEHSATVVDCAPDSSPIIQAALWYTQHVKALGIPVICVWESEALRKEAATVDGLHCVNLSQYLELQQPTLSLHTQEHLSLLLRECQIAHAAKPVYTVVALDGTVITRSAQSATPPEYWSQADVERGLRSGSLVSGIMNVSKFSPECGMVNVSSATTVAIPGGAVLVVGQMNMNRSMNGDLVVVQVLPQSDWTAAAEESRELSDSADRDPDAELAPGLGNVTLPTGRVVGMIRRASRPIVASLLPEDADQRDGAVLAIPMDASLPKVRLRSRQIGALVGHRLLINIDEWPANSKYPEGHYIRSLGPVLELDTEVQCMLYECELEGHLRDFSEAAFACLPELPPGAPWKAAPEEIQVRRDLRSTLVFSVDPLGCEDIDDALSARKLPNGHYEAGVHIADVSFFVKPDTPLDVIARDRATSVYLVDRRLDMLPNLLSAVLCSLRCGVERYAVSVFWEFDEDFNVIEGSTWFGRTVISCAYSLAYEQADRLVRHLHADDKPPPARIVHDPLHGGDTGGPVAYADEPALREALLILTNIARKLTEKRRKNGAIDLASDELEFKLTDDKKPVEVHKHAELEANRTIMELMVLANGAVAEHLCKTFPTSSLLRRHRPSPPSKLAELARTAEAAGVKFDASSSIGDSIRNVSDRAARGAVALFNSLAARAMTEAEYFSTGDATEGAQQAALHGKSPFFHSGLALDYYTHFTSPIRRYADVVVHRQLIASLQPVVVAQPAGGSMKRAVAAASLPASITPSVLKGDLLNYQRGAALPSLYEADAEDAVPEQKVDATVTTAYLEPLNGNMVSQMCKHINNRNRAAKRVSSDSTELFLSLFYRDRQDIMEAVVASVRDNGLVIFLPQYGVKGPLFMKDTSGIPLIAPAAFVYGVTPTSSASRVQVPHDPFVALEAQGAFKAVIPGARLSCNLESQELAVEPPTDLLQQFPNLPRGAAVRPLKFKLLDRVLVQVLSDFSEASVRRPPLRFRLVAATPLALTLAAAHGSFAAPRSGVDTTDVAVQLEAPLAPSEGSTSRVEECKDSMYPFLVEPPVATVCSFPDTIDHPLDDEVVIASKAAKKNAPKQAVWASRVVYGTLPAVVAAQKSGADDQQATMEDDDTEVGEISPYAAISATQMVNDRAALGAATHAATARLMKRQAAYRHDKVSQARRRDR